MARASKLAGKVSGDIIKQRSRVLRDLAASKKAEFMLKQLNTNLAVLVEAIDSEKKEISGYSENYLPVTIPLASTENITKGAIITCTAKQVLMNNQELNLAKLSADDNLTIIGSLL